MTLVMIFGLAKRQHSMQTVAMIGMGELLLCAQTDISWKGAKLGNVSRYLGTGDGTEGRELLAQTFIIDAIVQVFHVQVDALQITNQNNLKAETLHLNPKMHINWHSHPCYWQGLRMHVHSRSK